MFRVSFDVINKKKILQNFYEAVLKANGGCSLHGQKRKNQLDCEFDNIYATTG